jgi:ribosomal protein S18 acetylase RimI-like enzyme
LEGQAMIIKKADISESDLVAAVAQQSREYFLPFLPKLHSSEDYVGYYRHVVFSECEIWIVQDGKVPVGFCAFRDEWIDHLNFLPSHVGRNLGPLLLNKAKEKQARLQLWVFQQNVRAISFYERHGFRK